jgi:RNA polymerase sigma factor (sigma-70 family)
MPFFPRTEHELHDLDDEGLFAHLREARAAGDGEQARLALQLLVFGYWPRVAQRVAMRAPAEEVEAITSEVVMSAIVSAFDGESIGEFRAWLKTVTNRRIADFHRKRAGAPTLVAIGDGEDGERSAPEPSDVSDEGLVETKDLVDRTLATLKAEHAKVVELHVLCGVPARDVERALGVSADNVAQIASRFRRRLREAMTMSGGG